MFFFPFSIDTMISREREAEAERQRAQDAAGRPPAHRGNATSVETLVVGGLDMVGEEVTCFYGRRPPCYAVYRTAKRVCVQYADDPAAAGAQRKALTPLYPIRGEINGLIDGWRFKDPSDHRFRRSLRFDRRVGDALVVAFDDDVPDAALLLARIKQDILNGRIAWARFEYLLAAFVIGLVMVAIAHFTGLSAGPRGLWAAAAAGGAGAFFSIAIGMRKRTVLPDLLWLDNTMDAFLRMIIGMMGAAVLVAIMKLKLFSVKFGDAEVGALADTADIWLRVLLVGFIAGFSERLVPDLLAKAASQPDEAPAPRRDPARQPAAGASAGEPGVTGATGPAQDALGTTGAAGASGRAPHAPGPTGATGG